jgi:hypothetical protein
MQHKICSLLNLFDMARASRTCRSIAVLFTERFERAARALVQAGEAAYGDILLDGFGVFLSRFGRFANASCTSQAGIDVRNMFLLCNRGVLGQFPYQYIEGTNQWVLREGFSPLAWSPETVNDAFAHLMHRTSFSGGLLVRQRVWGSLYPLTGAPIRFDLSTSRIGLVSPQSLSVSCPPGDLVKGIGALVGAWYCTCVNDDLSAFVHGKVPMPPSPRGLNGARRVRMDSQSIDQFRGSQEEMDCVISGAVLLSRISPVSSFTASDESCCISFEPIDLVDPHANPEAGLSRGETGEGADQHGEGAASAHADAPLEGDAGLGTVRPSELSWGRPPSKKQHGASLVRDIMRSMSGGEEALLAGQGGGSEVGGEASLVSEGAGSEAERGVGTSQVLGLGRDGDGGAVALDDFTAEDGVGVGDAHPNRRDAGHILSFRHADGALARDTGQDSPVVVRGWLTDLLWLRDITCCCSCVT